MYVQDRQEKGQEEHNCEKLSSSAVVMYIYTCICSTFRVDIIAYEVTKLVQ